MWEMQQRRETISSRDGEKQFLPCVDLMARQENGEDQI